MSAPPLSNAYIESRIKGSFIFKCCQCRQELPDTGKKVYRTFFDDGGRSIGDPRWRICESCVKDNHVYNYKLFTFLFILLIIVGIYKCR